MLTKSQRVQRARKRNVEYIRGIKASTPCADCGNYYPAPAMQFDHVRGEKLFILASTSTTNIGRARIDTEIAKCDVVCANCHAMRTFKRRSGRVAEGTPLLRE